MSQHKLACFIGRRRFCRDRLGQAPSRATCCEHESERYYMPRLRSFKERTLVRIFHTMENSERVRFINTLFQQGVRRHARNGTVSAVLSYRVQTAEAVS